MIDKVRISAAFVAVGILVGCSDAGTGGAQAGPECVEMALDEAGDRHRDGI